MGKANIAFVSNLLCGNVEACADLLIQSNRLPEAAFFARTYLPSRVHDIVSLWKKDLASVSESASNALASPKDNPNLFPDFDIALQLEEMFIEQRDATKAKPISAMEYPSAKDDIDLNLIQLIKERTGLVPDPAEVAKQAAAEQVAEEEKARMMEAQRLEQEAAAAAAAVKKDD